MSAPRKFGLVRNSTKTSVHPAGAVILEEGQPGHTTSRREQERA
jgi:hypothetical protein